MEIDVDYLKDQAELATMSTSIEALLSPAVMKKRFRFAMELARDLTVPEDPEYLIDGLAPRSGLMTIYGPPGGGKSFCALDASCHIAAGRPYFGRRVRSGPVIYIAAEAGSGMRKRVIGWQSEHGLRDIPIALISAAPNLGRFEEGVSNDVATLIHDISAQSELFGEQPVMVVIDTLARTLPGADENSSTGMGAFIKSAGLISQALGDCLVVAVHHTGKNTSLGMRGHSSLHGACDAEWRIDADGDGVKTVTLEKLKEGPDRVSWEFTLKQVQMQKAASEDMSSSVTTCVIVPSSMPTVAGHGDAGTLKGNDAIVLNAITQLYDQTEGPSDDTLLLIARSEVQELAATMGVGDTKNAKSQNTMINRAIAKLVEVGRIEMVDGRISLL
jgi:hypothetical protein